jgi:predicted nucleic acid-binding protein
LYGAQRFGDPPRIPREVEHFVGRLTVLPFDSDAAAHTAGIRTGNLGEFQFSGVRGSGVRTGCNELRLVH